MKKHTIDGIFKKGRGGVAANVTGTMPAPFPGKYPTRVCFSIKVHGRPERIEYIGKPNVQMMLRFHRFVERARLDGFFYYEFDRKNIVARMTMSSRASCERLRRYYHPWAGVYSTYEDFLKPFYRKKVGGATCYSQHKVNKISQVNEFKEWLVSQGLAPGHILTKKPAPKKPKTIEWRYNCGNCGHSYQRLSKPESLVVRCSLCGAFTSWTEKKSL